MAEKTRVREFVPLVKNMTFANVAHLARYIGLPYNTVYCHIIKHPDAFNLLTPARKGTRRAKTAFRHESNKRLAELRSEASQRSVEPAQTGVEQGQ